MSTSMEYGGYSFSPVPLVTLNKEYIKNDAGINIGAISRITLNGHLVDTTGGLSAIIDAGSSLRSAFNTDGLYFHISCDDNVLFETYPKVLTVDIDEGDYRWVKESPYTIQLEFIGAPEDSSLIPLVSQISDSWQVEFVEDFNYYEFTSSAGTETPPYQLRLTHDISAVGMANYTSSGTLVQQPWEYAQDYVVSNIGYDADEVAASGVLNVPVDDWSPYNHMRVRRKDEEAGSFSVSETWLVINTDIDSLNNDVSINTFPSIEDFTIEYHGSETSIRQSISINGTVQGLELRDYGDEQGAFTIEENKYENAVGYWEAIKDGIRIYPRANAVAEDYGFTLNTAYLNRSIGYNPARGTVSYSYEYDDRPSNCISGAVTERFSISDTNPTDVFAQILVLGRPQGPILQDLSTVTPFMREVNIDVIMSGNDYCSNNFSLMMSTNHPGAYVNALLCDVYTDLASSYGQIFKSVDRESWEPKEGHYTRNVVWTAEDCSTAPVTTFC